MGDIIDGWRLKRGWYWPAAHNDIVRRVLKLANKGWKQALRDDPALLKGLNVTDGKITYRGVAEAFGMEYHEPGKFVG